MMRGSIRAYARNRKERGLPGNESAVRKAIRANRIVPEADGQIDFAKADSAWAKNSDPLADRRVNAKPAAATHAEDDAGPRDGGSYIDARTRRERALAEQAEIDLAEKKKQLLPRSQVERSLASIGRLYAAGRENLPAQLAPKLVGKTDPIDIELIIRRDLRATDQRIADEIDKQYPDLAGSGNRDSSPDL